MKQNAFVISADGKYAVVRVDRKSMCDGCHKSGCSDGCALYKIFGAKSEFEAEAVNKAGAAAGDKVIVEASDKTVNLGAFFVFILPIIFAVAVYFISSLFFAEEIRILAAVISFFLYFAVLAVIEKARKNKTPRLTITEIINAAH